MIYRILVNERVTEWIADRCDLIITDRQQLRGPSGELSDVMWQLQLPLPRTDHSLRARYYFTQVGWRTIGRHLAAEAHRRGYLVKVIRRKNPEKSNVAYQDDLQIALLPRRGKR